MAVKPDLHTMIASVLYEEWDPIGLRKLGVRKNQYEKYVDGLIHECQHDPTPESVYTYLQAVFVRIFGRAEEDHGPSQSAARRIAALLGAGSSEQ